MLNIVDFFDTIEDSKIEWMLCMIDLLILFIGLLYIVFLIVEYISNVKVRNSFTHVIHVNGTRGKSSVCRLIDAGLRAGGYSVFTKTTGTSPRIIDVNGEEVEIKRRGNPNIKEQLKILRRAKKQNAKVIVVECMALIPELQRLSQNQMLMADIGVVTNVRRDHLEVMGPELLDVAESMGMMMPKNGIFITGDKRFYDYYHSLGRHHNTKTILAKNYHEGTEIDFVENIAIALEVCKILNVNKKIAIEGMKQYKKDSGALKIYEIKTNTNYRIRFVNAFAVNDPDSIIRVYDEIKQKISFAKQKFVLLINNRFDRAPRMLQHVELLDSIDADEIWITGSYLELMRKKLMASGFDEDVIKVYSKWEQMDLKIINEDLIIFAIGNVGTSFGKSIVQYMEKVGDVIAG